MKIIDPSSFALLIDNGKLYTYYYYWTNQKMTFYDSSQKSLFLSL